MSARLKNIIWTAAIAATAIGLLLAAGVRADAPTKINYQARLTNPSTGNAVADGDYTIVFSLYSTATGGTALWTETKTVTVTGGLFSVILGESTPLSTSLLTGTTYLGIKVGDDDEMTPRRQIVSVAYALVAQEANSLASGAIIGTDNIADGAVTPLKLAGPNPQQIALLRWYEANQTGITYTVGTSPYGIAFDGANLWIANQGSNTVTKLRASDGTTVGTYSVGTAPWGVAFDGVNVWVTNRDSGNMTKL